MFAKTIIDSDSFLDMPLSAQSLYFHLAMRADDDGFINNPKKIQRMIGASEDDCKLLIAKKFVIVFDTGVIVIRHWKLHNYIQKDRYKPTIYQDERGLLDTEPNGTYTECIRNGYDLDTQVRLGKVRVGKDRIEIGEDSGGIPPASHAKNHNNDDNARAENESSEDKNGKKQIEERHIIPPSIEMVKAYCQKRNNTIDPEQFCDYYATRGWKLNAKQKMIDWQSAIRTWEKHERDRQAENQNRASYKSEQRVVINGTEYIHKNGQYFVPGGVGIPVDPYAPDDLPF